MKYPEPDNSPCEDCDGYKKSDCCDAKTDTDILICSECLEHCGTQCDECEWNESRKPMFSDKEIEMTNQLIKERHESHNSGGKIFERT